VTRARRAARIAPKTALARSAVALAVGLAAGLTLSLRYSTAVAILGDPKGTLPDIIAAVRARMTSNTHGAARERFTTATKAIAIEREALAAKARALAQATLHLRSEHRMSVGRICADDEHHVGLHDRVKILRSGGLTHCLLETIAGGRMTDARAGINVVVAEAGTNQLLDEIGFFVAATGRGDSTDGVASVLRLDSPQLPGGVLDGFVPGHFAPRITDLRADHRLQNAIRVSGIADGEPALHAGVAVVGMSVLVWDHANDFLALHLGAERTTNTAIGAGRDDAVLRLALVDQRLFGQGGSRTGLYAGAARHTLRVHERLVLARRNL